MSDHYDESATSAREGDTGRRDLSISLDKANLYSLIFLLPVALLALIYFLLWRDPSFGLLQATFAEDGSASPVAVFGGLFLLLAAVVLGIVANEMLHGISWVYLGKKSWSAVEFGVQWKALTPYAHLQEPIEARTYRYGIAMPGLVLGIVPSLIGIATGIGPVMLFGLNFTLAAAVDTVILWVIRDVSAGRLVEDHPSRAGCYVLEHPPTDSG